MGADIIQRALCSSVIPLPRVSPPEVFKDLIKVCSIARSELTPAQYWLLRRMTYKPLENWQNTVGWVFSKCAICWTYKCAGKVPVLSIITSLSTISQASLITANCRKSTRLLLQKLDYLHLTEKTTSRFSAKCSCMRASSRKTEEKRRFRSNDFRSSVGLPQKLTLLELSH